MSNTSTKNTPDGIKQPRSTNILDAAAQVLLRYGFRKASVDEVAQVAGISRQGLYRHFPTKDSLFAATVMHLLETSITSSRAALASVELPLEERLLNAFESMIGESPTSHLNEILEIAERLTGQPAAKLEGQIIAEFTTALDMTPDVSPWRRNGDTAESVAILLYATSAGLKHIVSSTTEYSVRMRQVIQLICNP